MWRKFLYSGFETCFGPSTQGAGIRYQNTSQIQIFRHFEKKGRDVKFGMTGQCLCIGKVRFTAAKRVHGRVDAFNPGDLGNNKPPIR